MKTHNSKMQKLISVLIIVIGILLMTGKIYADSEPGALPLLLIVLGTGGYFITRSRIRSQHNQDINGSK